MMASVLYLNFLQLLKISRKTIDLSPIQFVAYTDFDCLKRVKDIQLGQIPRSIAVNRVGVSQQGQVKPSTPTRSACCCSKLMPSISKLFSLHIIKLGGKWALSNSCCVGLGNSNYCLYFMRSYSKSGT